MICHLSGYDDHPELQIEPDEAPARLPDPSDLLRESSKGATTRRETRKEKRRKLFASVAAARAAAPAATAANQPETGIFN
jgi:hypothetical protein